MLIRIIIGNSFNFDVMKNYLFIFLSLLVAACSDADLQIEAIDFDNIAAQNCGTLSTETELFFKIDDDQTLILQLESELLRNEISTDTLISSIPNQSQLSYRLFNETVTSSYFCDNDIPPVTPTVIEEIEASDGEVLIFTTTLDSITFTHDILLRGIIITNASGESIIDLTTTDFTSIETSIN